MPRRSAAKVGLRNKLFEMFYESFLNAREYKSLEYLFQTFRSMPAIIEKDKAHSLRVLRHAAYEACEDMRQCGILVLVDYSTKHHHKVIGYKVFEAGVESDIIMLKVMQRKRVNRVQATSHITMDQIQLATNMGMSMEAYMGSLIIHKAEVHMVPAYDPHAQRD